MNSSKDLKFIDICCGIGGFHQALANMGMKCVMACDIDKSCRENYKINYNIEPLSNVSEIDLNDIPGFDVLCAGFPCQPFSKAGQQNGFEDSRGNIFFDICKIINHKNPKFIILENVRNLSSHDKGNTWKTIKNTITELGYNTYDDPLILNTLYFGVPQSRERVVILCKRKDIGDLPILPKISKKTIKDTNLKTILEKTVDKKYVINKKFQTVEKIWNDFLHILINNNIPIPKFPIWTDWWDSDGLDTTVTKIDKNLSTVENNESISIKQKLFYKKYKSVIDKNRCFYQTNIKLIEPWLTNSRKNILWKGAVRKMEYQVKSGNLDMNNTLWSPRGSGVRIKDVNYAPTLVAMASMIPVYGPESRQLTPRECARLQSFSEDYIIFPDDKISYKQFGNAVNVKMIEKSARFLINNELLFDD